MPYKIVGNKVVKKNTGKVVGKSSKPKAYLRVLNAIEHDPAFRAKLNRNRGKK